MQTRREKLLNWVRLLCDTLEQPPSTLASNAGVHASTLNRFLAADGGGLNTETIEKLENYSGIPLESLSEEAPRTGLREPDAVPYEANGKLPDSLTNPSALLGDVWVMQSKNMQLGGILPGDLMDIAQGVPPLPGDVVCAQVYDNQRGTARTLIRRYMPPFLVPQAADPLAVKPILIAPESVTIMGVIMSSWRQRKVEGQEVSAPG